MFTKLQMAKLSQENVAELGDAAVAANLASDVCIVAVVNGENANDKIASYAASESYVFSFRFSKLFLQIDVDDNCCIVASYQK